MSEDKGAAGVTVRNVDTSAPPAAPPSPAAAVASSAAASDTRPAVPVSLADEDRVARELAALDRELIEAGSSVASVLRLMAKQLIGPF